MKVEMILKFDKATKNTYVFAATKDDDPIPTVYVRKSAFQKQPEKTWMESGRDSCARPGAESVLRMSHRLQITR